MMPMSLEMKNISQKGEKNKMKELYYRIELSNGTILPYRFERLDQVENFMIRNDIYGYIIIM